MAEQLKFNAQGWPEKRNHEVNPHTSEELLLIEALRHVEEVSTGMLNKPTHLQQADYRVALLQAKANIEEVLKVVSDYSHMKARIEELEDEVETKDCRISELEEELEDPDDPDSIPF